VFVYFDGLRSHTFEVSAHASFTYVVVYIIACFNLLSTITIKRKTKFLWMRQQKLFLF